jgi:hypothetical protein
MIPADTIPLSEHDPERVRNLIAFVLATHDEPERVARFLRCGATVLMRRRGDMIDVTLAFTATAPVTALLRAAGSGTEPEQPTDAEAAETISLASVRADTFGQPPQG